MKRQLKSFFEIIIFRIKGIFSDSKIARGDFMLNSRYISLGNNVRIKKGYRIECYDSFGGAFVTEFDNGK